MVPVHSSATAETLQQIFDRAKPSAIVCSEHLRNAVNFVLLQKKQEKEKEKVAAVFPTVVLIRDSIDPYAMRQDPKVPDMVMPD